jgi:TonB family protein
MKSFLRVLCVGLVATMMVTSALGQRPRVTSSADPTDTPDPAPQTVKVKYEGGVFGYNSKQDGTLTFDDANRRLVFRNKYQKEVFPIPYDAVLSTFADTQAKRPTAASIISSAVPYGLGLPALFIKKKYRYLTLQFQDPDTRVSGVTSFKLENKEILASVVYALATKAGLEQRGEVFVRKSATSFSSGTRSSAMIARIDGSDPISGGVLNGRAISLPKPVYPQEARDAKVSGTVTVQITIDEEGKVIFAKAVSGHHLLQDSAVAAAREAKFSPTSVDNQPVKVSGMLTYAFEL